MTQEPLGSEIIDETFNYVTTATIIEDVIPEEQTPSILNQTQETIPTSTFKQPKMMKRGSAADSQVEKAICNFSAYIEKRLNEPISSARF